MMENKSSFSKLSLFFFSLISIWFLLLIWGFSYSFPRPYDDFKNFWLYLGSGVFFIFTLIYFWKGNNPHLTNFKKVRLLLYLWLAYCAWGLITTFSPISSTPEGLIAFARLILLFCLTIALIQLPKKVFYLLGKISVVSAAAISLINWFYLRGFDVILFEFNWAFNDTLVRPMGHVSYYSDFMGIMLPLGFYFIFASVTSHECTTVSSHECTTKNYFEKILFSLSTFLIFGALWFSGTRAAIVGLFAAMLYAFFHLRIYRKKVFYIVMVVIIAAGFLFAQLENSQLSYRQNRVVDRIADIFDGNKNFEPGKISPGRWQGYVSTLDMIWAKPIEGWGLGSYRFIYNEFAHGRGHQPSVSSAQWYMHSHNEILNQWAETGLVGLILFFLFFFFALKMGFQTLRLAPEVKKEVVLGLSGLVLILVSWQFGVTFLVPITRLFTCYYIALLIRLRCAVPSPDNNSPSFFKYKWPAVIMVSFFTLFLTAHHFSNLLVKKAQREMSAEKAKERIEQAYLFSPGTFDTAYLKYIFNARLLPSSDPRLEALLEVLRKNYPTVPLVLFQSGLNYMNQKKYDLAKREFEHAFRNDPSYKPAQQMLEMIPQIQ